MTVLVVAAGCSSPGPEIVHYDTPLPTCDELAPAVEALGMPSPVPGSKLIQTPSPAGFDCAFSPPEGSKPPVSGYVSIVVLRPTAQVNDGKPPVPGSQFDPQRTCATPVSPNPDLPEGSTCYVAKGRQTGSATVYSATKGAQLSIIVQWSDDDATADQVRTATLEKANSLTQTVIQKL